jgi:hypothetical protein
LLNVGVVPNGSELDNGATSAPTTATTNTNTNTTTNGQNYEPYIIPDTQALNATSAANC